MDFSGRYSIPALPDVVWAALNNPETLKACIPGCEQMDKTDATHFQAVAALKIGPVKATFKAKVALEDLDPPRRCTLRGEGQGGVAGFAKGEAEITLTPEGNDTVLTYNAKANIGGKLAQIGQRLIDGAAKQIADEFFERFTGELSGAGSIESVSPGEDVAADSSTFSLEATPIIGEIAPAKREGMAPEIWVVGLIAVIIILLVLFGVSL